jgi:hypothetical protein
MHRADVSVVGLAAVVSAIKSPAAMNAGSKLAEALSRVPADRASRAALGGVTRVVASAQRDAHALTFGEPLGSLVPPQPPLIRVTVPVRPEPYYPERS